MMKPDTIIDLLEGRVTFKKASPELRKSVKKLAGGAPEVMVKMTGNAKGAGHVVEHLNYISRNGKLDIENERGEVIKGKKSLREVQKEWTQDLGKQRAKRRDTTNLVLSMPKDTDPSGLKKAARAFAKRQFGDNYQYVFALHTSDHHHQGKGHPDHPHIHLTIKNLGHDGKRLHVKKGDPQKWRERFAVELERQGIEAEATSRAVRGVIKKAVSTVVRQVRDKGEISKSDQAKVKEILEEMRDEAAGKPLKPKPWEKAIEQKQTRYRKGWLSVAKELNASEQSEDKELADKVTKFVANMPDMKTERHEIKENLAGKLQDYSQAKGNAGEQQQPEEKDEDEIE